MRRVVFNVPGNAGPGYWDQHIYNTSNQSWSRFVGRDGLCWVEFNTNLYFGKADGSVWAAESGTTDNGVPIYAVCQQAWNNLGIPTNKRVSGVRPVVQAISQQAYDFYIGYDYQRLILQVKRPSRYMPGDAIWDVALWDSTLWSVEGRIPTTVRAGAGSGTVISVHF
jgi:hypothetical protein